MSIKVSIFNRFQSHDIKIFSNSDVKVLEIPYKPSGYGSSYSGAELLFLALATCICNDLYREASKKSISLTSVEVTVTGKFEHEGQPGTDIRYSVVATSDENTEEEINDLIKHVDKIAEIHNTVRKGTPVVLVSG